MPSSTPGLVMPLAWQMYEHVASAFVAAGLPEHATNFYPISAQSVRARYQPDTLWQPDSCGGTLSAYGACVLVWLAGALARPEQAVGLRLPGPGQHDLASLLLPQRHGRYDPSLSAATHGSRRQLLHGPQKGGVTCSRHGGSSRRTRGPAIFHVSEQVSLGRASTGGPSSSAGPATSPTTSAPCPTSS